jgi:hypothetical protein
VLPAIALVLAWLAMLALNPADVADVGCQLSFLCVALLTWEVGTLAARNGRKIMGRKLESAFVLVPGHQEAVRKMRGRVGPQRAGPFGLRAHVDPTDARNDPGPPRDRLSEPGASFKRLVGEFPVRVGCSPRK